MNALLNFEDKPRDPIAAIMWLDGVLEQVQTELDDAYAEAYFEARLQRRFPEALLAGRTSKKRALALTRKRNEQLGRSVRWGDGHDPSSSAYEGG
jgi:hypothetical protein